MKSYTVEELLERADDGRKQIAMGNYADIDDMLRELDEELQFDRCEPQKQADQLLTPKQLNENNES